MTSVDRVTSSPLTPNSGSAQPSLTVPASNTAELTTNEVTTLVAPTSPVISVQLNALLAKKPKVLLVDDERILLSASKELLESSGYEVMTAQAPNEATLLALQNHFDIVISDYDLKFMKNGLALLNELVSINPRPLYVLYTTEEMETPPRINFLRKSPDTILDTEITSLYTAFQRYRKALAIYIKHTLNNKLNPIKIYENIIKTGVEDISRTRTELWKDNPVNVCNKAIEEIGYLKRNNETKLYFGEYGEKKDLASAIGYKGILGYASISDEEIDKTSLASIIDIDTLIQDLTTSFLNIRGLFSEFTVEQILDDRDSGNETKLTDLSTEIGKLKSRIEMTSEFLGLTKLTF